MRKIDEGGWVVGWKKKEGKNRKGSSGKRAGPFVYRLSRACYTSARSSNSGDNAGSPLKYSTARFTNDELVGPKTPLRVAVLRWGLRGRSNEYRGHRFAGGVAASGLLQRRRAEPHHLVRRGAEGPAQEAQAVRSHRLRATCHHEAGRWRPR